MKGFAPTKIGEHAPACRDCGLQQLVVLGDPPHRQQATNDDTGVEKISQRLDGIAVRGMLEGKGPQLFVPSFARKEACSANRRIPVRRLTGPLVQENKSADRVPSDLRRDRGVLGHVDPVVTRKSAAILLDTGTEQPRTGTVDESIHLRVLQFLESSESEITSF